MKNKIIIATLLFSFPLACTAINDFQQNIAAAKTQINAAKHTIAQMTMLTTNRTMATSGVAERANAQRLKTLKNLLKKEIAEGFANATKAQKIASTPSQHTEVAMLYNQLEQIKKQSIGF